ncbi:alpha/beta hydrolase fold domain-containing protein [Paractinoplanes toevensis]|uniref:Esterase n=1 Tax=Paractinoplanes toevensis TaxID=571911 RepID=A0A919W9U4_9ACTN|nr:alpha/beta hydrolase fold domain-containing protein [Actinoplanes toevensis]GIM96276.1 esterase [Actinoplanes toevensis]
MPIERFHADRLAALERFRTGAGPEPAPPVSPPAPAGVITGEISIPGPHGPIRLRTYRPDGPPAGLAPGSAGPPAGPGSALLWAHGGGFRHGSADMPEGDWVSAQLAARAGAYVVSVDYRLATEGVRYPVPLDDVFAAWTWFTGAADLPDRRAIGGASAGAALALAATLRARDAGGPVPDALLLAYPFAHFPNPAADADLAAALSEALPPGARFTAAGIEDMVRNYVGRISDLPPDALPGAARLTGLPPAWILLSEYDDLRTSGELLARQLDSATVFVAEGAPHGHLNHPADLPGTTGSLSFFAAALVSLS